MDPVVNTAAERRGQLALYLGFIEWTAGIAADPDQPRPRRAAARVLRHFYTKEAATLRGTFTYRPDRLLQPEAVPSGTLLDEGWVEARDAHRSEALDRVKAATDRKPKHAVLILRALRREGFALERARGRLAPRADAPAYVGGER